MPDVLEDALQPTVAGDVKPSTELEVGECFAPFIPQVLVSPAPSLKRKPPTFKELLDETFRRNGWDSPAPTDPAAETGTSTSAEAGSTDDTDAPVVKPAEILPTPKKEPPPPAPRTATALEIFTWIKWCLLAQTHLPVDAAEMIAFWVISTWFQDDLSIRPCLVITGPAHDAEAVLSILRNFCPRAALLAGLKRGDLGVLRWACQTNLVWEPNLDKRTAALVSSLTVRNCMVVGGGALNSCSKSTAIYAGEVPAIHKIQHSINVHITTTNAVPPAVPQHLHETIERLPVHLDQYHKKNLDHVHHWAFVPYGVPSETAAVVKALGSCIVDAPQLWTKLVAIVNTQGQQRRLETSDTTEAVVVKATLALSRDGREHAYVREIAAEVNRRLEARGETAKLSPEKIGHRLKNLGLRTRPLSQSGNGLMFDKVTVALIQQLAAVYVMEDMLDGADNLHSPQTAENK
jgi:hypothetical protein